MNIHIPENDALTGLPSLRQLSSYFEELIRDRESFALLVLDIDTFSLFNDAYGHIKGDTLLERLADSLRQAATENIKVFRSAGDEFTIFFDERAWGEIVPLAMQIRESLNKILATFPFLKRRCSFEDGSDFEFKVPITVSGCIVFYPIHGSTFDELRSHAEDVMYLSGRRSQPGGVLAIGKHESIHLVTGPTD